MVPNTQEQSQLERRGRDRPAAERRHQERLPEELTAVITDSAVASQLFSEMPDERRQQEAEWVAGAADRSGRARRAVEVVRHALHLRAEGRGSVEPGR